MKNIKFTEDHKKEVNTNYFEEGIHEVTIGEVTFDETQDGKPFVEFVVLGENDEEGKARMWFTTDAAINFTLGRLRGIFVHNTPEAKKEEVRRKFDAVEDSKALERACQSLVGKKCWYTVYKSDRTYQDAEGNVKNSYDRNIYHYEPKPPAKVLTPENTDKQQITKENIDEIFGV